MLSRQLISTRNNYETYENAVTKVKVEKELLNSIIYILYLLHNVLKFLLPSTSERSLIGISPKFLYIMK